MSTNWVLKEQNAKQNILMEIRTNGGHNFSAQEQIAVKLCTRVEISFFQYFRGEMQLEIGVCAVVGVNTDDDSGLL